MIGGSRIRAHSERSRLFPIQLLEPTLKLHVIPHSSFIPEKVSQGNRVINVRRGLRILPPLISMLQSGDSQRLQDKGDVCHLSTTHVSIALTMIMRIVVHVPDHCPQAIIATFMHALSSDASQTPNQPRRRPAVAEGRTFLEPLRGSGYLTLLLNFSDRGYRSY
jgi:hypothetical protein